MVGRRASRKRQPVGSRRKPIPQIAITGSMNPSNGSNGRSTPPSKLTKDRPNWIPQAEDEVPRNVALDLTGSVDAGARALIGFDVAHPPVDHRSGNDKHADKNQQP